MLTGSELTTAIAAVLIGAICLGFVLHWFWLYLGRKASGESAQLHDMAERLHDADLAREAAEKARQEAEARLAMLEAESTGAMADMRARLDGAVEGREAELARELSETALELETMRDGLGNARRRIMDLENAIEEMTGKTE